MEATQLKRKGVKGPRPAIEEKAVVPNYLKPGVLNKLKYGQLLKTEDGFNIRRILGGFMYEYPFAVQFVSNDELSSL